MTSIVYKNTQLYNFYQIQRYALVCYNLFVFQDIKHFSITWIFQSGIFIDFIDGKTKHFVSL